MSTLSQPNLWRFDDANSLYYALLNALITSVNKIIATGKSPVLALPTGNTMIPFYRLVTENQEQLQTSKWICFNLDEYYPIRSENEPLTFNAFMHTHFYSRLKHPVQERRILNGRTEQPHEECAEYEGSIEDAEGIDISILGLGMNGHIAFNEPGSKFDTRTRLIELHPETLMSNFKSKAPFTHAMTMGIGTLLESREIFVVALGKNKAQAVKMATLDPPSKQCPASALRNHARVTWFLDQEAASLI